MNPNTGAAEHAPGRSQNVGEAVAALWGRFKGEAVARVDLLGRAIESLRDGQLDEARRLEAERAAHALAGSLGTFGFPEGTAIARQLEEALRSLPTCEQAEELGERVHWLRQSIERPLSTPGAAAPLHALPLLLIIDRDRALTERMLGEAWRRGIRATGAHSLAEAREAIRRDRPAVVLLDLSHEDDHEDGLHLLEAQTGEGVPVYVQTERHAFLDRVEVAKRGGRGFLQKPLPPAQAIDIIEQHLKSRQDSEARVLAVDDDPQVLALVKAYLETQGTRVTTLSDPLRFWDVLEELGPDLVVLDVEMPQLSGFDLCRVVRNDPRWSGLPIVFMTAHTDEGTVHEVFAAGADDFVSKPFVGPELYARICNRLERTRLHRQLAETDPLTGLANRRKSTQTLGHYIRLSQRHGQPFAFAVIDLDHFKQVNDAHGHALGDEVLRRLGEMLQRSFRGEDVVARWGGEEFVVGMFGMSRQDAVQRLAEVLEAMRQESFKGADGSTFRVTFSGGVAELDTDGADLGSLYRAADKALYRAKEYGRNRVLPVGWQPPGGDQEAIDIVLVDDDVSIAALLMNAFETRGYRAVWLQEGFDAAEQLPRLRPRVAVLDFSLPGLNGLSLLKRMADGGLLRETRVIMLTARSAETDVRLAKELGAFDYVSKPFNVGALIQRIRRALAEEPDRAD